jgi:hypothetical protein
VISGLELGLAEQPNERISADTGRSLWHPDGVSSGDDVVVVPLDDDEWRLLRQVFQWGGPARMLDDTAVLVGYDNAGAFYSDRTRLIRLVDERRGLAPEDWRRLVVSTELLFASNVVGCGLDWSTVSGIRDDEAIMLLRSVQRKLLDVAGRRH